MTIDRTFSRILLIVLCASLIGGATNSSAQNGGDKTLTAGTYRLRQSEVDQLIELYEWAFETRFTAEQREKFRGHTESEFRRSPAASRTTIDDIVITLPKILAAEPSVRRETRKKFLAVFLPDARQNSDENSRMLLGIYEAARRGGGDHPHEPDVAADARASAARDGRDDVASPESAGGDISGLVGKWVWGRSGSYTTNNSGVYLGGNGSRHTYQFFRDGAVEYVGIMNVMTGGCNMQIFRTAKGRARASGATLTIDWSPAEFSRDDSCSPSKNYKKTLPAETETFQIRFKDASGQRQLCLTGKDETCFSPTE